ncbi:SPASM domain-containing protein [Lacrimispora sp.]|uniref:SPASM domain-containing protein n=1 Tax=Lacrimispora sp. TaxID=2719234 RepID=UPI0028ADB265|nr:radical SAM protein [Lacrimispora sp.]
MKNIVIFGAGKFGKMALKEYGKSVEFFVDNNADIIGKSVEGIPVIDIQTLCSIYDNHKIIIATKYYKPIINQLLSLDIKNYDIYQTNINQYYPTKELVWNPYQEEGEYLPHAESVTSFKSAEINNQIEKLYKKPELFNHIEIETINRCNGNCDFCPVSIHHDTRKYTVMDNLLFEKIINQLAEINYCGKIALFSNNEPFLDPNIIDRHKYTREKLPHARIHLFTNGTLLDLENFTNVMKYLDELIIDNYQQELKLIKPCKEIQSYCEQHPELKSKVTIVLRKPHEILSSRGGDAPNREKVCMYPEAKCVLPFKQMIIRPDGKVSLCCNDPLGKNTLGDASKDPLLEIWNNDRYKMIRQCLYNGREHWNHCKYCDTFNLG